MQPFRISSETDDKLQTAPIEPSNTSYAVGYVVQHNTPLLCMEIQIMECMKAREGNGEETTNPIPEGSAFPNAMTLFPPCFEHHHST